MPRTHSPNHLPARWTVYGVRPHDAGGRHLTAAVHKEGMTSERDAISHAMKIMFKYPQAKLVVVHMWRGIDANGDREVIVRHNGGKAWWE